MVDILNAYSNLASLNLRYSCTVEMWLVLEKLQRTKWSM